MKKLYMTLATAAILSTGSAFAADPIDITPSGLDFDKYEDGAEFKLYSTESTGWSAPADFYHGSHPTAFDDHGQLTYILYRGLGTDLNCQENIDAKIQPMVTVRKIDDFIGKALVINEQYSPTASKFGWPGSGFSSAQPQFGFYLRNEDITNEPTAKHYVRVRLVYNVLFRGCHYTQDAAASKNLEVVRSIYATHEGNWVVPSNDHEIGAQYAETGMDFAQWEGETGRIEDIPENPVVRAVADDESDPWDEAHHTTGAVNDVNGKPAYIMNSERFRVYEFDTYVDNPSAKSISVQFNISDRNISYIIKEIKFFDLGTDEASATLLGKRQLGWKYYNAQTSGISDIAADEAAEVAPVYYNLQGVQVNNPSNGIFIVKRGNKVSKEIIR